MSGIDLFSKTSFPSQVIKIFMLLPQTVDTYYRRCSSSTYVGNVAVPLLCISALDDPVCTLEAIPWDECRSNCSTHTAVRILALFSVFSDFFHFYL